MIVSRRRYLLRTAVALALLSGVTTAACAAGTFPAAAIQFRPVVAMTGPGEPAPPPREGTDLVTGREGTPAAGNYLLGPPVIDGAAVARADAVRAQVGNWVVRLELTPAGGTTFDTFTADKAATAVAIVVDGNVISAPVFAAPTRGSVDVVGTSRQVDAEQLAATVRGER